MFCLEYFYHSLPQKEAGRKDTPFMFCTQNFFELKSQMLMFSGLFAMDGFRYKLHCKPLLCSLSAFHYTGKHPCLSAWDWPSAREICTRSCFRATMSGLNLQHQVKCQYTRAREVHICYAGEVLCVQVSWASPSFAQELPDMEPTYRTLIFYLF